MADEAPVATTEGAAPVAEPTLEDVYKSVANEQSAPQQREYQPAPQHQQAPVAPSEPYIPDPYDTAAFKAYIAEQAKGNATTQEALRQVAGYLTQQQQREAKTALDADLKSAVETVNEVVGHPKPKVIEAMLDAKAREDVRFKNLWENRAKNPAAWNNALKAVSKEFATDLSVKVDPALRASQQARKLSQGQMATTDAPKSETEEWESLSVDEQQKKMNRLLNASL